jgi:hypothetical protein
MRIFSSFFQYIRAMKDAIDRCTYLFYTSVQVPYTIVLYRANTELVFVLRPVKVGGGHFLHVYKREATRQFTFPSGAGIVRIDSDVTAAPKF